MKVFLTGGTGYLGGTLLRALLDAGHEVTALTRRPQQADPSVPLRWVEGDLAKAPPEPNDLRQCQVVVHAAAMVKTWSKDRREFDRHNVEAYEALLGACARAGVSKIVHTSSFLSIGPSPTPTPIDEDARATRSRFYTDYERTKYLADQITDKYLDKGLPIVTLYPTVLFGPGGCTDGNLLGKMIYWIREGTFPGRVGSGEQVWSYGYVPDVVDGHISAMERGMAGHRYILGGENVRLNDVLSAIYKRLNRPESFKKIPVGVAEALGKLMEWGAAFTGKPPELTKGVAGVYREHWSYSSERAERALGYQITPFETAIGETVDWVRGLDTWGD